MSYQRTAQFQSVRTLQGRTRIAQPRSNSWGRNQNTTRFTSSVRLGPVAHTVLIALMITVLGLIYLSQATKTTSFDFQSNDINKQIAELKTQKTDLQVENARVTALEAVQSSTVAQSMTKPSQVNYATE